MFIFSLINFGKTKKINEKVEEEKGNYDGAVVLAIWISFKIINVISLSDNDF